MSSINQTQEEWAEDFSYDYYRKLLRILQATFEVRTISEYPDCRSDRERVAFVRHDVDVCMDRALEMAHIEHQLGVQSVYMVNPDTPLYDLDDESERLFEIHDLGHEIGLHCDLDYEMNDDRDSNTDKDSGLSRGEKKQIEDARCRLESIVLEPVTSLSFHQPAERVIQGPSTIAGMVNTYSSDLMTAYISDSAGRWREGPPTEMVTTPEPPDVLQVLTHPVWWANRHAAPIERLLSVTDKFDMTDNQIYAEIVSIYPEYSDKAGRIVEQDI